MDKINALIHWISFYVHDVWWHDVSLSFAYMSAIKRYQKKDIRKRSFEINKTNK